MRVLVTGGRGFLGNYVVNELEHRGHESFVFSTKQYDLRHEESVRQLFSENGSFDAVIHLAADVGGVMYNKENPGSIFYNNAMMNLLVQEYARMHGVKKFVGIGSACSYPKSASMPMHETALWAGYPEETNAPYGISKLLMLEQSKAYRRQYHFSSIHLVMMNLYGPGDSLDEKKSHVIPAVIMKTLRAVTDGIHTLTFWGDGSATREFLYIEDAARGIVDALERYDSSEPVNIGAENEISIKELVETICSMVGFSGTITWDVSKPSGQPRRAIDISRAMSEFGFRTEVDLHAGLDRTIEWYRSALLDRYSGSDRAI